jgi:hypothetical protein
MKEVFPHGRIDKTKDCPVQVFADCSVADRHAHTIHCQVVYGSDATMLKTDTKYNENYFESRRLQTEKKRVARMVYELQKLGFEVKQPA